MSARRHVFRPSAERLDNRVVLSALSPSQMSHAYGFDSFHFVYNGQSIRADGSGQTIALIEAHHDPKLFRDLDAFDSSYNLPVAQATQY
jgi:subtilase family serine protease